MWIGSVLQDQNRYCPKCGEVQQPGETTCRWCGTPLDATPDSVLARSVLPAEPPDDARYCVECGTALPAAAKFCFKCGAPVAQASGGEAARPVSIAARTTSQATARPTQGKPQQTATGCVILAVLLACGGFWFWSQVGGSAKATPTVSRQPIVVAPSRTAITYSVTGTGGVFRASLTYENEQGGTEQADVALPWTKSFSVKPGSFIYISAQNTSNVNGGIACDITASGRSFKHSESSGVAVIASCDGSAP